MIEGIIFALVVIAALLFVQKVVDDRNRGAMITVEELKQKMQNGEELLVLDVRTEEEFAGSLGHVPGAVNIPLDMLDRRAHELVEWMEMPLIVICRTDARSASALRMLNGFGFADVAFVKRGMVAWNRAHYDVERGLKISQVGV